MLSGVKWPASVDLFEGKKKKNYNIIHIYFDLVCIRFHERRDLFIGFENK